MTPLRAVSQIVLEAGLLHRTCQPLVDNNRIAFDRFIYAHNVCNPLQNCQSNQQCVDS